VDCSTLEGKPVSMNLNAVPLVDPKGQKMGVVLVLDDITSEKRVKSSLSRYMSKDVVEQLLTGEGSLALGGVRQEASILFSDIRSYTTLTESQGAHEIVGMLNEYFSYMVDVIFEHQGLLDKFIGDAIMAVFDEVKGRERPAERAVRAALAMQEAMVPFNAEHTIKIGTRIGINTGPLVRGDLGSRFVRRDYTVIGDAVNRAQRHESTCPPGGILISESTWRQIAAMPGIELDVEVRPGLELKGLADPVTAYLVKGIHPSKRGRS
jgi:adenylate cyclase